MELGFPILVVATVLFFYCTGGAWMLLVAGYPVHRLVGADEFAPFHKAFGRRLIPAFVIPSLVAYALTFALAVAPPYDVPRVWAYGIAAASALNLLLTFGYVVRKRRTLAREGKSDATLRLIVWAHFVRTLLWTGSSFALLYLVIRVILL